ncbi:ATP-binding protein [Streptomyces sp. URMC 129]|uniref:ATP-binding protein n=1 Tax=Streptomyces sp. URMC 129 TaxID=3423407 RepID=UPI003F1C98FB
MRAYLGHRDELEEHVIIPAWVQPLQPLYRWAFAVHEEEIHQWRRAVARSLTQWHAPHASVELACFGVSELLANVIKHSVDQHCRLEVTRDGATAVVSVLDRSPVLPVVTVPDRDAESGRGLWVLQQMAGGQDFGFRRFYGPWKKAVWFRCHLPNLQESR